MPMPHRISHNDMLAFATTLWRLGANEPEIGVMALGCAIRNRLEAGDAFNGACLERLCAELCDDRARSTPREPDFSDPAFRQSFALGCRILNDEFADPTAGATHFHRHDELPAWASQREPLALLGSRFYYAAPPNFPVGTDQP